MKQVVILGGEARVLDVPAPQAGARSLLVRVRHSCISVGTEIAGVQSASTPLYRRALKQPEKIRRAIEMVRDHGLRHTLDRARGTATAVPLGYSAAGTVVEAGEDVQGFVPGDAVACAGAGIANHAELIDVPVNLAVKVPEGVASADAATVALGAIALQGVRRAAPTLGETVVVVGLGLLGQITAQLLRAAGCRVVGIDPDAARVDIARKAGMPLAVEPAQDGYARAARELTDGHGADAVIITAATASHQVVNDAMAACRRKGRVVLVGDVGLHLDRAELYRKELDVLISTSYGPGRYDPEYELAGADYPLPYVRWTENRNMGAYLDCLAGGQVKLDVLTRGEWPVAEASAAYGALKAEGPRPLLALLGYPDAAPAAPVRRVALSPVAPRAGALGVALVGAGGFAQAIHLPNLQRMGDRLALRAVMSRTGTTARVVAERHGAAYATTDAAEVLADPAVAAVIIATRHDLHAPLALAALEAGKHVFLEKPLALDEAQLGAIERFYAGRREAPMLMTGFNRRFSPALQAASRILAGRRSPLVVNYRMNAGFLPREHWVHGPEGGGRNIGEACHVYDAFNFLTGSRFESVQAEAIAPRSAQWQRNDNFVATVRYADGSLCTLTYTALGAADYPKERMEIFADGMVLALDDYRSLAVSGAAREGWKSERADKGHAQELEAFAAGLRDGAWPITLEDQVAATRISFLVEAALHGGGGGAD
jgi:predicted dehydrogenase/threonine dehydrogenase-like Zn-dependent dehydrogenase